MTVQELRERRNALGSKLLREISDFERSTGCTIAQVILERSMVTKVHELQNHTNKRRLKFVELEIIP
jgi:hypothetical protein